MHQLPVLSSIWFLIVYLCTATAFVSYSTRHKHRIVPRTSSTSSEDTLLDIDRETNSECDEEDCTVAYDIDDYEPYPHYGGSTEVENGTAPLPVAGLIVVDGFCTYLGRRVADLCKLKGVACVQVMSDHLLNVVEDESLLSFRAPPAGIDSHLWAVSLPFPVIGACSESDAGLETAERLQADLCGPSMGGVNAARRDKFLMGEALRSKGLAVAQQIRATSAQEVETFISTIRKNKSAERPPVIVKPLRGCASGDVFLCKSSEDVEKALATIIGKAVYGTPSEIVKEALVQEFLEGTEYAIDFVSCQGKHKALAVWRYEKLPVNGAPFVYFKTELCPCVGVEADIVAYARQALDALGVAYGAAHMEVMLTKEGPVLIEYNGRWHLTDFGPLCNECVGYNAVDATVDAYVDPEAFHVLPDEPTALLKHGCVVHFVSYTEGPVQSVNYLDEIKQLESYRSHSIYDRFVVGRECVRTIDIRSDAGWVRLCHEDPNIVQKDYERIKSMMPSMFTTEGE